MTLAAPGDALQQSESRHNDAMSGGPPRFFSFVQLPSGTVVVGSCTRGMSRSVDEGKTWTPIDALSEVSENGFAVAPDSAVLVATSGGLARSTDDAVSWEFLDDEPVYATLPDGADRPDIGTVYRLHELPDGRRLAGTDGHGVWIRDGGEWMPSGLDGMIVYSLADTLSGALLAGTRGDFIWRSEDDGATWLDASKGLPDSYVHCLHVRDDGSVLAATGVGVARSDDDGKTWTPCAEPLEGNRIFSLTSLDNGQMLAGGYTQVWLGSGESWEVVDPGLTPDEAWAVYFVDGDRVLAGTKAGILESHDRGSTWTSIGESSSIFSFLTTSDGTLLAGGDRGVLHAPDWEPYPGFGKRAYSLIESEPGVLLVGTLTDGLYRHDATGFSRVAGGPHHRQIFRMITTRAGSMIACTGAIIDGVKTGGIFVSHDRGASWSLAWEGENVYCVVELSDGTLFAGARRCLVLESTDDGMTWSRCPRVVEHSAKTYSLNVDRHDRLYLGGGSQLLRSADRARTWTVLDDGLDGMSIYDMQEGPDGTLVVATSAGMYVSTDGGDSWRAGRIREHDNAAS
jgi:photosystem II stability/assembly factor-like uncharacterized protein